MLIRDLAIGLAAASLPFAANAATYDLFDSFNGTNGGVAGSAFSFGYTGSTTFTGALTAFERSNDCAAEVQCVRTSADSLAVGKAVVNGGSYSPPGSTAFYDAGELNFIRA